jgi:hypothetical protein
VRHSFIIYERDGRYWQYVVEVDGPRLDFVVARKGQIKRLEPAFHRPARGGCRGCRGGGIRVVRWPRWLGWRWQGVPVTVRWWRWLVHGQKKPWRYHGCGCLTKGKAVAGAAKIFWHTVRHA